MPPLARGRVSDKGLVSRLCEAESGRQTVRIARSVVERAPVAAHITEVISVGAIR